MDDPVSRLRPATRGDLGFIQEMLYQAANRPGVEWPAFEDSINLPRNRRHWVDFPRPGDVAVIAERARAPVGAAWIRYFAGDELSPYDEPEIPVLAIGVIREHRGSGVGGALMTELVRLSSEQGIAAINLTTGKSNSVAIRLYQAHGFEDVRRYPGGLQMQLKLA